MKPSFVLDIVKEVAGKANLESITRRGIETMKEYLLEYMRMIVEELIETSRSARNTSYLTTKNSESGSTVSFDA